MAGACVLEWVSPDSRSTAKWRPGGELWMSGPEWGWLTVADDFEIKGALPEVVWSDDGNFLAFVKLHIEDVPTRQRLEGLSFRIGILRISDLTLRNCGGHQKLASLSLKSMTKELLLISVEGKDLPLDLKKIRWD